MKIGLFFGSFNPIHTGHLILAQTTLNETPLDYVWFVVSPQNPFKQKKNLLSAYDRFRMAELAVEKHPRMLASNVEFSLPNPSYTIDTLTHLREVYDTYSFSLIMGQDNLQHIHKWKNHEALVKYYPIYVYPRINTQPSPFDDHPNIRLFEAPLLNISATYIRKTLGAGKSVQYMVPDPVLTYLMEGGLLQ